MSETINENKATRILLPPTSLPVNASKTMTALTYSGTTATATYASAHGYSVGQWLLILGSDQPQYNGPTQIVSVPSSTTLTYTVNSTVSANSTSLPTSQLGIAPTSSSGALWGNGTTPSGSPPSLGGLPTAIYGSEVIIRITNPLTGPSAPATALIYESDTGAAGTWRYYRALVGNSTAGQDQCSRATIGTPQFVLVFFYANTGAAVVVEAWGNEITSAGTTP